MRKPEVSPNGLASAIQMTQFFINRAGKSLDRPGWPAERKARLKQAISWLQVELRYLKTRDLDHKPSNWDQIMAEYQELELRFDLKNQPSPVHPPPAMKDRIGGRNGYNWS